jgi:hypothetical protein
MKKGQDTRGYERYMALDTHREYILVGGWNEKKDWVLTPRRVGIEKFGEWAKKNIRQGDIVVLETTTNIWAVYDIVAPLASRVLVANATEVWELAGPRVTPALAGGARETDKEDIKRLLKLLVGGIVPEVWVPPMEVRELRAFISYRSQLVTTATTPALAVRCKCDPQSSAEPAAQTQPAAAGRRTFGRGLVAGANIDQHIGKDADPPGTGLAGRGGEA